MMRIKLIIFMWEYVKDLDRPVLYFDYPRYSMLWYLVRKINYYNTGIVPCDICVLLQSILFIDLLMPVCDANRRFLF